MHPSLAFRAAQNDPMIRIAEAAKVLGTSADTLRRLARAGELPEAVKIGKRGCYRVPMSWVLKARGNENAESLR
jgi:excisionase family DNA binding protein